jgi:hypothetical protein
MGEGWEPASQQPAPTHTHLVAHVGNVALADLLATNILATAEHAHLRVCGRVCVCAGRMFVGNA